MRTINLTKGKTSIVDDDDYEKLAQYKWCASRCGNSHYAMRKDKNDKGILMHRFILNVTDRHIHVDHINHDTLDNRKINIRTCTQQENNRNKSPHSKSTSKYLGVSWDKLKNKWKGNIYVNKKLLFLGRFNSEEDAAKAYDLIAKKEFQQYANLNFK